MICKVCRREFAPKKANQHYCDGICRRRMEAQRKRYDMHLAYIERAELIASNPENSELSRKHWAEFARQARAKLPERP